METKETVKVLCHNLKAGSVIGVLHAEPRLIVPKPLGEQAVRKVGLI